MIFEITGQKENWLIFEKDGRGVEFKSNTFYKINTNEIFKYA